MEDHATLSSDYLQTGWDALAGEPREIEPDGAVDDHGIVDVKTEHDPECDVLTISYRKKGDKLDNRRSSAVALVRTPCRFGGARALFLAPCCGRRVRSLALMPNRVACRRCGRLVHRSTRKSGVPALVHRADRIIGMLGAEACGAEYWYGPIKKRPRGMSRERFARLAAEHDRLVRLVWAKIQPRMVRAQRRCAMGGWLVMARAGM